MEPRGNRIDVLEPLALAGLEPFARGRERLVFAHPLAARLVVKVVRPDRVDGNGSWIDRFRRLRHYTLFLREIREYLALRARVPGGELPVARILGLVDTDLGIGLVSELVEYPAGTIAPTLAQLLESGVDDALLRRAVNRLGAELVRHDIVVNDINRKNLVACQDAAGALRLVLIDGFGDKNWVPLRSMSALLNRRNTRKRIARLLDSMAQAPASPADARAPERIGSRSRIRRAQEFVVGLLYLGPEAAGNLAEFSAVAVWL